MYKIILISFFIFSNLLAKPRHCEDKNIKSVNSNTYVGSKKIFKYYYQKIIANKNKSKPVFVIIPGGPGDTSIRKHNNAYNNGINGNLSAEEEYWNLPARSNIIFTDPRSQGCNQDNELSKNTYRVKNQVNDILHIIKKEKLTNYILVGLSYGSAVATQLAYAIEQKNTGPSPKAVILTGVVGKAIQPDFYEQALSYAWISLYAELPQTIKKYLPKDFTKLADEEDWVFPFGIDTQTWIHFLQAETSSPLRDYFVTPTEFALKDKLMLLKYLNRSSASITYKNLLVQLKSEILNYQELRSTKIKNVKAELEAKSEFYKQIWFNEFFYNPKTQNLKNFFDSKKYPIKSPVIYLHGTWDVQTSLKQALYHYKNQKYTKNKYFIKVNGGGHYVLPVLNSCTNEFWSLINNSDFKNLNKIIKNCNKDLQLVL